MEISLNLYHTKTRSVRKTATQKKAAHLDMQQALIAGCVANNRAVQRQLYEQYYGGMLSICMRYSNDYEEAKDILNEGFMKVFKNIHKFEPRHSLASWIKRIMINTAIDHYRKNKKHNQQVDIEYAVNEADVSSHSVLNRLSAAEIMKLVQRLTPAYRTVFSLYVIEGYKHHEIASMLEISEGTSKSNLAKARAKLQHWIKTELPEYAYYG